MNNYNRITNISNISNMLKLLVKSMTGELVQVHISSDETVNGLKTQIADDEKINVCHLKLIHSETGQELSDKDKTLKAYGLENEQKEYILYMLIRSSTQAPFTNERCIELKGHDIPALQKIDTERRKRRLQNFKNFTTPNQKGFQGDIDEFFSNEAVTFRSKAVLKNIHEFRQKVELKYVYTPYHDPEEEFYDRFIATNQDSSIVYFQNKTQVDIYIRGYFIPLTTFRALTPEEIEKMMVDDELLTDMVVNWLKYSDRYHTHKGFKIPKPHWINERDWNEMKVEK